MGMVDAFVDELDLTSQGFAGTTPASTGRPSYAPAVLPKIYIHGYPNAGLRGGVDRWAAALRSSASDSLWPTCVCGAGHLAGGWALGGLPHSGHS